MESSHSDYTGLSSVTYEYKTNIQDAIEGALEKVGLGAKPTAEGVGKNVIDDIGVGMNDSNAVSDGLDSMLSNGLSTWQAESYGSKFGNSLGMSIASSLKKAKLPTLSGNVKMGSNGSANITFSAYAAGGFPTEGEMFVANEAGPELVGTIGNRSAVVNNDQIVESVSKGVYQAVASAMGQSGGTQVVEAKVNDKVLFEVVVDRNRRETMRTGYSPLVGGV